MEQMLWCDPCREPTVHDLEAKLYRCQECGEKRTDTIGDPTRLDYNAAYREDRKKRGACWRPS